VTRSMHVFEDVGSGWRWHLVAGNGRKIASSGESFDSRSNALRAARAIIALLRVPVVFHLDTR
jgi:uncharacterized protein YegP (UPF0339 family)